MKSNPAKQVVIVDDDPDFIQLVKEALAHNKNSCSVKAFSNAEELFSWLTLGDDHRPNVIFLDIQMPGRDGFDVLKSLKTEPRFRAIPVVMLTTSEQKDDVQKAYIIGANAYMVKPAMYDKLKQKMESFSNYWFDVSQTVNSWNESSNSSTYPYQTQA